MELRIDKSDWVRTRLGDVCTWYQREIPNDAQEECGIEFYVTANHIDGGEVRFNRYDSLSDGQKGPTITKHFEEGDLLLSTRSVALRKAAIAPVSGVTGEKLLVLRTSIDSEMIPDLMPFVFQSDDFWNYAQNSASGSVNKFTSWTKIREYEFLLPPKDQQAEIAELLWAMDDVLQSQFAFKDLLAITLESMAHHYTMGRALGLKEPFCDSKLGLLPESWEAVKLGDFCSFVSNGFVGKVTDFYSGKDKGVPYIQGMNVRRNHFTLGGLTYVTRDFHERQSKTKLEDGDLLTVQSGHIGETAVVPPELDGANCHAVIISRLNSNKFDASFVARFINGPLGRMKIRGITVGTTVMHINTSDFKKFYIPKAPLDIQKEIAKNLDNLDSVLSQLERETHDLQELKKAIISGFFGSTIGHV